MKTYLVILSILVCFFCQGVAAKSSSDPIGAFASFNAETLKEIALEMYPSALTDVDQARRAMILLEAVRDLNSRSDNMAENVIKTGVLFPDNDYEALLNWAFKEYLDEDSDLSVLRSYLEYGLSQLNTREQREQYLTIMQRKTTKVNDAFASEIGLRLAVLDIEKGDSESAMFRLKSAYNLYPYNVDAFKKLESLYAEFDLVVLPSTYSGYLRREMTLGPSRISAALAFADYTDRLGLYDIASKSYDYVAYLYTYLYPEDQLPKSIYMPWAVACYNTQRSRMKCFEIAAMVRRQGRFDLLLEGLTANVASEMGNFKEAKKAILAGQRAEAMLTENPEDETVTPSHLAWFYIFASPNYEKALAWANRAYSVDAQSEQVKSLLGYAFVLNKNHTLAKEIVEEHVATNQIASLAMAMIKLNDGDRDGCIEGLKESVKLDPSSLAAEHCRGKLKDLGSDYIADVTGERVLQELKRNFGQQIVPVFTPLNKLVEAKLSFGGLEFRYGRDLIATLSIRNRSLQPILISDGSFIRGDIRIDAEVSGDITRSIPKLVQMKIRNASALEPNKYFSKQINLMTGELKAILIGHPQANLKVKFTLYIDPVENQEGNVANLLRFIKPVNKSIKRIRTDVQRQALITQLRYLSSGQTKQRIRGMELFSGLMMEHYSSRQGSIAYSKVPVELPLLGSALRRGLNDEDWTVRFQTMAQLYEFDLPLEFSYISKISESLYSDAWPERLMALLVLSKSQGEDFKPVLQSVIDNDIKNLVRLFAEALQGDQMALETINIAEPAEQANPEAEEMVDMLLE